MDSEELAARLRARRNELGLSLRSAAQEAGVSAPTMSRVERGDYLPERDNLFRLLDWLEVDSDSQLRAAKAQRNRDVHSPGAPTMEAVELHLRADRDLAPEDADALSQMFRLAYERLRKQKKKTKG